MNLPFSGLIAEWKELERFNSLDRADRAIVFYAEDSGSWVHFRPIIEELIGRLGRRVCYVTSSANDPVLDRKDDRLPTFQVGFGPARTNLFRKLQAGVMVMTMPDLQSYNIKRSRYPVHYVYVHHSMVSTHMIYRTAAFDNFDTILCVGPHHKAEIEEREAQRRLTPKNLVEHGYGRLDSILDAADGNADGTISNRMTPREGAPRHVLVAPSWGKAALLEACGRRLIEVLVAADYHVTVRPHPITVAKSRRVMAEIKDRFGDHPLVNLETDVTSEESLHSSDIMISDWSGAALEYAFGLERPVLFIDLPRKVRNPEYEEISCVPIEVALRTEIGAVVPPDALDTVPNQIEQLAGDPVSYRERLKESRQKWVYNVGSSGAVGADYIAQAADLAISGLAAKD